MCELWIDTHDSRSVISNKIPDGSLYTHDLNMAVVVYLDVEHCGAGRVYEQRERGGGYVYAAG